MGRPDWAPEDVDIEVPSAARVYDYLLGGSHNFGVDRQGARQLLRLMPDAESQARDNRAFLHRAVRYLVSVGVRQFLDVGSGIPTVGNVHEIAQRSDPKARVVYVDIDPIAVRHSKFMLRDNDHVTVIQEDLRRPRAILEHPDVQAMLDFDQPVAVLLVFILHAISDEDEPHRLVATLRDALASGSHIALSHITTDSVFDKWEEILAMAQQAKYPLTLRTRTEIEGLFEGFKLVEPGLVRVPLWRPDSEPTNESNAYAGVGRKP